jgi:uncharacterized circularly permuted ATP-grasp superfamily protein
MFRRIGITFGVYGDKDAAERLIPFDIVPRVIARAEWTRLEAGLIQRVTALNLFLKDVYGARAILKENIIPLELILRNPHYRPEMIGRRTTSGCILPASTLCASTTTLSTSSKTTRARLRASPICSKTAK